MKRVSPGTGERQHVVVTGAAWGIGRGVAAALADRGAAVTLADMDGPAIEQVAAELARRGGTAYAVDVDVTSSASVNAAFAQAERQMGRIDGLVCAAGGFPRARGVEELDDDEWRSVVDLNLFGTFACCRAVFPALRRAGGGSIVCVASEAGRTPGWLTGAHYVAAKSGVIGLARHLAREGGPHGIRVNAVAPGTTLTERVATLHGKERISDLADGLGRLPPALEARAAATPLGRLADVEDQVGPILYLLSDQAAYVTGATLDVNGGRLML